MKQSCYLQPGLNLSNQVEEVTESEGFRERDTDSARVRGPLHFLAVEQGMIDRKVQRRQRPNSLQQSGRDNGLKNAPLTERGLLVHGVPWSASAAQSKQQNASLPARLVRDLRGRTKRLLSSSNLDEVNIGDCF